MARTLRSIAHWKFGWGLAIFELISTWAQNGSMSTNFGAKLGRFPPMPFRCWAELDKHGADSAKIGPNSTKSMSDEFGLGSTKVGSRSVPGAGCLGRKEICAHLFECVPGSASGPLGVLLFLSHGVARGGSGANREIADFSESKENCVHLFECAPWLACGPSGILLINCVCKPCRLSLLVRGVGALVSNTGCFSIVSGQLRVLRGQGFLDDMCTVSVQHPKYSSVQMCFERAGHPPRMVATSAG